MTSPSDVHDTIRAQGQAARELYTSPAYTLILNALSDFHMLAMVESEVGHEGRAKRDRHHTQLHALRDLNEGVLGFIADLDALEASEEREREQQDDE